MFFKEQALSYVRDRFLCTASQKTLSAKQPATVGKSNSSGVMRTTSRTVTQIRYPAPGPVPAEGFGQAAGATDETPGPSLSAERGIGMGTARTPHASRPLKTQTGGRRLSAGPLTNGAQGRIRTSDTTIFSRMLYRLSYLGTGGGASDLRPSRSPVCNEASQPCPDPMCARSSPVPRPAPCYTASSSSSPRSAVGAGSAVGMR